MKKKKLEKVLIEAVNWIITESSADICQLCSYYNPKVFEHWAKQAKDDEEPCHYCRRQGKRACQKGVIRYFAKQANVPKSDIEDCELSRIDLENRNRELRREVAKLKNEVYFTISRHEYECEKAYFEGRDEGVKKTKDSERLQVALQVYALMTKEYEGHVPPLVADKIFDVIKPQQ